MLVLTLPPLFRWGLLNASWLGDSRGVCDAASQDGAKGACWVFVKVRLEVFLYGFYPLVERWRVNFVFIVLAVAILPILAPTLLRDTGRQVLLCLAATLTVFFLFGSIPSSFHCMLSLCPLGSSSIVPRQTLPRIVRQPDLGNRRGNGFGCRERRNRLLYRLHRRRR